MSSRSSSTSSRSKFITGSVVGSSGSEMEDKKFPSCTMDAVTVPLVASGCCSVMFENMLYSPDSGMRKFPSWREILLVSRVASKGILRGVVVIGPNPAAVS